MQVASLSPAELIGNKLGRYRCVSFYRQSEKRRKQSIRKLVRSLSPAQFRDSLLVGAACFADKPSIDSSTDSDQEPTQISPHIFDESKRMQSKSEYCKICSTLLLFRSIGWFDCPWLICTKCELALSFCRLLRIHFWMWDTGH